MVTRRVVCFLQLILGTFYLWSLSAGHVIAQDRATLERYLHEVRALLQTDLCTHEDDARSLLARSPVSQLSNPVSMPEGSLAQRLKQAVVMVVTPTDSGSGFFVDKHHIVTNYHVVSSSSSEGVFVAGPGSAGIQRAEIIATLSGKGETASDFALLKVNGPPSPGFLPLAESAAELEHVIAAGFPALVLGNDVGFRRFMKGDLSTLPDVILSRGSIMAIQNRKTAAPSIAHSASISGGSSGGPLVDACGRAIGINTFIRVDVKQASNTGYAIPAGPLIQFLKKQGIQPTIQTTPCTSS
ncbi:trypsin-like peptidase domain-containing protein [Haematospirillum jordaniae]|uniref:Serine protease n=1 Tax=Haematospirillum jordaniae TaxID=1549855 RepID=A0A143DGE4_9PROT|nr:serine protease [Haematospirillum jordaniae]AMW35787.1 hypothetical protein AY555_10430 [Haematospirillum jordaniae]NKD45684.1 trypsin-like peptidase domain-containing protein [Haematospirillum jordaniae]NKD57759.1 trypsin-like peptidase domain-containing protein [Haematospirillum jordaniae]NKD59755.1 trypsin-like peptidase domain-containing protein [Haematospirillum jordaniae]NKD67587.1 trypsin-like peptidase domain-containing protein [Haematospirillum jordaniae]